MQPARKRAAAEGAAEPGRGGALVMAYDHALMQDAPLTEHGRVTAEQIWENMEIFLKRVRYNF